MVQIDLVSCNKYLVVAEFLGHEYTQVFYNLDDVADYVAVERGLKGVYKIQIINLPNGVYTRKTESWH